MNSAISDSSKPGIFYLIRALNSRNYRLFFSGQSISLVGSWMTDVATLWLVTQLTGSALMLGIVSFASRVPAFFLAPVAGVWIDQVDRRKLLVITQVLSMLQSLALAILVLSGLIEIWHIIALSIFQGLINSFDMPTRQALVVQMVDDKSDLSNAIALNSSMINLARIVGPSIAGLLIVVVGEGWCFLLDGVSYIAVIASVLMMRITPNKVIRSQKVSTWEQLQEGWKYVSTFIPIRSILLLLCVMALMGLPYRVLLPVFVTETLRGEAFMFGVLSAAAAIGAFTGAILLASRSSVLGLANLIPVTASVFGAGLILLRVSHSAWVAFPLMVLMGLGGMLTTASGNTLLQTLVDEEKRGRVMSFYTMSVSGVIPFGSLLGGALANWIGITNTYLIGGAVCVCGAFLFYRSLPRWRRHARPIYREKGILPPVAKGLKNARN